MRSPLSLSPSSLFRHRRRHPVPAACVVDWTTMQLPDSLYPPSVSISAAQYPHLAIPLPRTANPSRLEVAIDAPASNALRARSCRLQSATKLQHP
jgi:hypothetical protein